MVEAARSGIPALRRAFELKAKALGRAPGYEIRYQPAPDDRTFSVHDALVLADEVAAKLGPDYRRRLRERMSAGWLHLPPDPKKRGIFEVFPALGEGHPFMLTSYRSNFRSARQLTGALMDLMKSADTPVAGRPDGRDDPPTYGNGVLYAGDILFENALLSKDREKKARIADLVSAIDLVFSNFYETAMMSELDAKVQALVVDGKPPSGAEISTLYRRILNGTFGEIPVDDAFGREWMLYSVTFLSYEHQFWGSAFAAGAAMAELVEAGDPNGRKALDEVYGRGDTDRSDGLLRMAGIDMETAAPYEAVHRRMARVSSELASLLGEGASVLSPSPRTGAHH
jgi:oligoendopeptidase F